MTGMRKNVSARLITGIGDGTVDDQKRLAAGEITTEEYQEKKKILEMDLAK